MDGAGASGPYPAVAGTRGLEGYAATSRRAAAAPRGVQCGNANDPGEAGGSPGESSLFFVKGRAPWNGFARERGPCPGKRRGSGGVRAGSVGLGCEAGLGTCRGWWSSRPVRPPSSAAGSSARGPSVGVLPPGPRAGERQGLSRAVSAAGPRADWSEGSGMSVVAATLDARRALLADLPSYGVRRVPFARAPAGCLGWRLAAGLELVDLEGLAGRRRVSRNIAFLATSKKLVLNPADSKGRVLSNVWVDLKNEGRWGEPRVAALEPFKLDMLGALETVESSKYKMASRIRKALGLSKLRAREVHMEGQALVRLLRRRWRPGKRISWSRKSQAGRGPLGSTSSWRYTQKRYTADKSLVIKEVLQGKKAACGVPLREISTCYDKLWGQSGTYKGLEEFGDLPKADNSGLYSPISATEVISALRSGKKNGSPGPDKIGRAHLLAFDPKGTKLAQIFNKWLVTGEIPLCLKESVTSLIPKVDDEARLVSLKNWRPITLSSVILRVFSSVINKRLTEACPVHPRQRGFIASPGCAENVLLLNCLIKDARVGKRPLAVVFIDLRRAFDMIPHSLIIESLNRRGLDPSLVKLIQNAYSGAFTRVRAKGGLSKRIVVKRGVKQGDPLSPTLFNLSLDPLLYALDKVGHGIYVTEDHKVTALAYADDLILLSESWEGMERNLQILDSFSMQTGLDANPEKCSSFWLSFEKRKPVLNCCPRWSIGGEKVKMLSASDSAKYLGMEFSPLRGLLTPNLVPMIEEAVVKLDKASLRPSQKLLALRTYVLPKVTYQANLSELSVGHLKRLDGLIRSILKKWLGLPTFAANGLFYSRFKDGGLNVARLERTIPIMQLRRASKLLCSSDPLTHSVAELIDMVTRIKKLQKTIGGEVASCKVDEVAPRLLASKKLKLEEHRAWIKLKWQGMGVECFQDDAISNAWLRDPLASRLSESDFITALRLRSSTVPCLGTPLNRDGPKTCRLCGKGDETLVHIVSLCSATKNQRMSNHNNICDILAARAKEKGWVVFRERHLRSPKYGLAVPDIIAIKGELAVIIDVAISFESSLSTLPSMEKKKKTKYMPFRNALKGEEIGVKTVETMGFPMGARGKWHKGNESSLERLGFTPSESKGLARYLSLRALQGTVQPKRCFSSRTPKSPPLLKEVRKV
uniref:ribonuclease H n=1 Tax=Knipowitschia caucasica TaxID=637954 RepID=A0AAV2LH36_KNICA